MNLRIIKNFCVFLLLITLSGTAYGERREAIYRLGIELEEQATYLAESSFDHFRGWKGEISDEEQSILFKSEAFASSCRLFLKLAERSSGYFNEGFLRTNMYSAFIFLLHSFKELEKEMGRSRIRPSPLSQCRRILNRMDREFSKWPAADNLAYLHQNYVKAQDATVYLIERKGIGEYIRRPFKNLESLYRYNYDRNRGKDPWKYLVEVSYDTLGKMKKDSMINLNFEGMLVIEKGSRPNRPVYIIEGGKKRGISSPEVLSRFGGWNRVFEVPVEVINKYPEGEPVK
ncbi:MAG: hypothetical protein ACETWK_10675 [Candidatus Aminicenantaceae bacterium]